MLGIMGAMNEEVSALAQALSVPNARTIAGRKFLSGNLFGQPAGTQGLSVGHGWVALLHPLTPGTHTIVIDTAGAPITTTIVVKPGGPPARRLTSEVGVD